VRGCATASPFLPADVKTKKSFLLALSPCPALPGGGFQLHNDLYCTPPLNQAVVGGPLTLEHGSQLQIEDQEHDVVACWLGTAEAPRKPFATRSEENEMENLLLKE